MRPTDLGTAGVVVDHVQPVELVPPHVRENRTDELLSTGTCLHHAAPVVRLGVAPTTHTDQHFHPRALVVCHQLDELYTKLTTMYSSCLHFV